jgi:ring-1,2-phenylacetyl-CoA epoxidase subunit PaaE
MAAPQKASRKTDWTTLGLLLAMYALLAGNFVWYRLAPLPLVAHVLIAAAAVHLAFTVWHEAVHRNVSPRPWVNQVVGVLGMFPYMTPYFMQRWIHLEHHARLNEREDPNFVYVDGPFWRIPLRYPRALGYARKLLAADPRRAGERVSDLLSTAAVGGVFAWAWWNGMLFDAILLWLVPVAIAKLVMDWYINYLPHVGLPPHRFRGTRIVDLPWLTPLVLAHNYHAIHHLWPTIPWHGYRAVFRERRDYLREHGVPIERAILGVGPRTSPASADGAASG